LRSIIEELGYTVIALIVASVMVLTVFLGIAIPGIRSHTEISIPQDTVNSEAGFSKNFNRTSPVITVSSPIIINSGSVQIDFDDYISNGTIKAINADGADISSNIMIKAGDTATARLYDESGKIFGSSEVAAGDYNFIISVIDYTNEKYYGKVAEMNFTVSVTNP
jgi:hypothetical protein